MSWSIFKQEMLAKEQSGFKSTDEYADFFTKKYDECMKRGLDLITGNTVMKGNTELMNSVILYALELGNQSKVELFYNQSISLLGKGAVAYWTGCEMTKNIPLIPAPGTILNISVVSNTVTNPGVWPEVPIPVIPTTSYNPYIDAFILQSLIHLTTVGGLCNTISQYPPLAPIGPAILIWTGFQIDTAGGNAELKKDLEEEFVDEQEPITKDDTPPMENEDIVDNENTTTTKVKRVSPIKRKKEIVEDSPAPKSGGGSGASTVTNFDEPDDNQPPPKIYGKVGVRPYPKPPNAGGFNGKLNTSTLVEIATGCSRYGGKYLLQPEAAQQYFKLKELANKSGFKWTITSAYRNIEHQVSLGSASTVAKPGASPHGWAVAIDFGELFRQVGGSGNPAVNRTGRETSKLYRFLSNNAPQFGWYNPYRLADGGGVDEMWHWEYWGFFT